MATREHSRIINIGSNAAVQRGSGPRVLLVHGTIVGGETWAAQRPLARRWTTVNLERRGYGQSAPTEGEDFEVDARDIAQALGEGAHLVAHSYGGIGALLAAAERPDAVHSLTLVEPMAYSVALDNPAVKRSVDELTRHWTEGPDDPHEFLEGFLGLMGLPGGLPKPLPAALEHATRLLMRCSPPWTAEVPLDRLAELNLRTLVISGGHSELFDAVCDRLEERLVAERAVIPGAQHAVPRVGPPFNERLERFLSESE